MPPTGQTAAVPAQLSLLAIYNPSLGTTDETIHNQIAFYYPKSNNPRSSRKTQRTRDIDSEAKQQNEHEKLRQIGLAQGLVSFAKNFSNGESVDAVETEKSRIVLHELETGWWILARIDLTRLPPGISALAASRANPSSLPGPEYSSRDVAPPFLIRQQLLKAHSIFLLHHAQSLNDLYSKQPHGTFYAILERFWSRFIWNWDILLNGNPVVDILNGIKLAGGGELGIGVGEEEWGSGEREVLEGFVSRTEGLADIIVSKFGSIPSGDHGEKDAAESGDSSKNKYSWIGCDTCPGPYDGVIFSGVGEISRPSLAQVSQWMEWIYRYGEDGYGVKEDPTSVRRQKRRKDQLSRQPSGRSESKRAGQSKANSVPNTSRRRLSPGIPPPLVVATDKKTAGGSTKPNPGVNNGTAASSPSKGALDAYAVGAETFMKVLTLGYGSTWGNNWTGPPFHPRVSSLRDGMDNSTSQDNSTPASEGSSVTESGEINPLDQSPGHFILGLRDDLENGDSDDDGGAGESGQDATGKRAERNKILLRTLNLRGKTRIESDHVESSATEAPRTYRVVVYLYQPFMFTFLFEPETPSLSSASFYRSIHHQLGPLQKSLLQSTSPNKIHQRLSHGDIYQGPSSSNPTQQQVYDVIFDPTNFTIRTSLPNIPTSGIALHQTRRPEDQPPWQRMDALNVHTQLINTYIETRSRPSEVERTCKTNRGWWVLWMRLRDRQIARDEPNTAGGGGSPRPSFSHPVKEAFLVRKASDYSQPGHAPRNASGSGFFRNFNGPSIAGSHQLGLVGTARGGGGGWGAPGKIAEGVGLDARRYIESLLSLNR